MRLRSVALNQIAGIDRLEVGELSDIVVLAGPNGVGKTRALQALITYFRNPTANANCRLVIEATSEIEAKAWSTQLLDTGSADHAAKLRAILQRSQRRNRYRSTVLNFEGDRTIINVQPFSFTWDIRDPYEEDVGWDSTYAFLRDRFNDVRHSLFRLVETKRRRIAQIYEKLEAEKQSSMPINLPDPLAPYRKAFEQLLSPKKLVEIDVKRQQIIYEYEGNSLELNTLSSGEREVVNIVFDFLLRNPSDCIILFDEPELHLHPELSYKLLQTLSSIGQNNQFIFCTHSPEIITASIENTVIFLTPKKPDKSNQAITVRREDATNHALDLLGQSIGIISLGKKLLLIEGHDAGLDKQTYGAILQSEFPDLVLVPVGGKQIIHSFEEIRASVLNQTIWGVEFFMLCDRDAQYDHGIESFRSHQSPRLRALPRYHLENYFIDETILAAVFADMEHGDSWLKNAEEIRSRIREIAKQTIPVTVALKISAVMRERAGNIDIMPKGLSADCSLSELIEKFNQRLVLEQSRISNVMDTSQLEPIVEAEFNKLHQAVETDNPLWRQDIPGKIVLNRFSSLANMQRGRLKTLYIRKARESVHDPFAEIREVFRKFREVSLGNC